MPIIQSKLEQLLQDAFPGDSVIVEDLAGDNDHYRTIITSSKFAGLSRLEQHKLVHRALINTEAHDLHALSIQTKTP